MPGRGILGKTFQQNLHGRRGNCLLWYAESTVLLLSVVLSSLSMGEQLGFLFLFKYSIWVFSALEFSCWLAVINAVLLVTAGWEQLESSSEKGWWAVSCPWWQENPSELCKVLLQLLYTSRIISNLLNNQVPPFYLNF